MSLQTAYQKRVTLVVQCLDNDIRAKCATTPQSDMVGNPGKRSKCTTLGKMRKMLKAKGLTPYV